MHAEERPRSALAPERLRPQVPGDAELTRHQCRPGKKALDHHQRFVFDFVGVERLVDVAEMVADAAAEASVPPARMSAAIPVRVFKEMSAMIFLRRWPTSFLSV